MNGRVARLLVFPLLTALEKTIGPSSYLEFMKSFKYPLAGHLATLCPGDYDIDYRTFAPEPGACVIMDGKVFHGTYPALGERRAFVCDFTYDIVEGI